MKEPINDTTFKKLEFIPQATQSVDLNWQHTANILVDKCHQKLMGNFEALNYLIERGLSIETVSKFSLGLNEYDLFEDRTNWGLPEIIKDNGCTKKQWLPKGIVIPSFVDENLTKIKIRRGDWNIEGPFS